MTNPIFNTEGAVNDDNPLQVEVTGLGTINTSIEAKLLKYNKKTGIGAYTPTLVSEDAPLPTVSALKDSNGTDIATNTRPLTVTTQVGGTVVSSTSGGASLLVTATNDQKHLLTRVTNGATAQYIQIWNANSLAEIASGTIKEEIYAPAFATIDIPAFDPSETYSLGILIVASSTSHIYTGGANMGYIRSAYSA